MTITDILPLSLSAILSVLADELMNSESIIIYTTHFYSLSLVMTAPYALLVPQHINRMHTHPFGTSSVEDSHVRDEEEEESLVRRNTVIGGRG